MKPVYCRFLKGSYGEIFFVKIERDGGWLILDGSDSCRYACDPMDMDDLYRQLKQLTQQSPDVSDYEIIYREQKEWACFNEIKWAKGADYAGWCLCRPLKMEGKWS